MKMAPPSWPHPPVLLLLLLAGALSGCGSLKEEPGREGEPTGKFVETSPDLGLLLSMSYQEAAKISPQKLEVPPFFKVAADEIEVVRRSKDGAPLKVRAKGKVFLEVSFREPAVALCQEAYFGEDEVILRGRPLLQRGGSIVEGLDASTVFYLLGLRLRVIGLHRLTNQGQLASVQPSAPASGDPALPWRGSPWETGPNPLLPPLSPSAVPDRVRRELQREAEAETALERSPFETVVPLREDASGSQAAPSSPPQDKSATPPEKTEKTPPRVDGHEPGKLPKMVEPALTVEKTS